MAALILNFPKMLPSVFAFESVSADECFVHLMCRGVRAEKQSHTSSIELTWLTLLFSALIALRAALHQVGPVRGQAEKPCEYCKHVSLVKGGTIPKPAQY